MAIQDICGCSLPQNHMSKSLPDLCLRPDCCTIIQAACSAAEELCPEDQSRNFLGTSGVSPLTFSAASCQWWEEQLMAPEGLNVPSLGHWASHLARTAPLPLPGSLQHWPLLGWPPLYFKACQMFSWAEHRAVIWPGRVQMGWCGCCDLSELACKHVLTEENCRAMLKSSSWVGFIELAIHLNVAPWTGREEEPW